jgi:hypothetical protein
MGAPYIYDISHLRVNEALQTLISNDTAAKANCFALYAKPEAAITVSELLMMGGVSSETC